MEESAHKSESQWTARYREAKEQCVSLLLEVGHYRSAFALSQKYLYFPGLLLSLEAFKRYELTQTAVKTGATTDFRSVHKQYNQLYEELRAFVSKHKDVCGTEDVKLLTFVLLELERLGQSNEMLEFGKIDNAQLMDVLKVSFIVPE
jgi:hypothetical protein